jgi:hypothetical protein
MKRRASLLVTTACCSWLWLGCEQAAKDAAAEPKPDWANHTRFDALKVTQAFEGNMELSVAITNDSSSPVIIERMDRDQRVLLAAADGAESKLHRFSVGVAKPILVAPKQRVTTSLLFNPLEGRASELRVYDAIAKVPASEIEKPRTLP